MYAAFILNGATYFILKSRFEQKWASFTEYYQTKRLFYIHSLIDYLIPLPLYKFAYTLDTHFGDVTVLSTN